MEEFRRHKQEMWERKRSVNGGNIGQYQVPKLRFLASTLMEFCYILRQKRVTVEQLANSSIYIYSLFICVYEN